MNMKYEIEQLTEIGCTEITKSELIHNYSYKFRKNGFQHTLSHYLWDNGQKVDIWTIWSKVFSSFEEALDYIKML